MAAPPKVAEAAIAAADDERATPAIVPGLYVGPFLYAKSIGWVTRHRITHIVNATPSAPCVHDHIEYLRVALDDKADAPIFEHFARCHEFIAAAHAAGGVVLIHCHMGRSRSVTLAAAYLMASRPAGLGWREALECVRTARSTAAPNVGFIRALRVYEGELMQATACPPQCTCKELAPLLHLRAQRCDVCDEAEPAAASDGAALARYAAFVEMLMGDSQLEEIAFVPGPLNADLFDEGDASSGVRTAPIAPLEIGLICAAHRLAIDFKALPFLLAESQAAWRAARASDGSGGAGAALERATRAMLLLTLGQNYTAWADRRRCLLALRTVAGVPRSTWVAALHTELAFSAVVLRSFTKSHESFGYRRWLLGLCVDEPALGLQWFASTQAAEEAALCAAAMARRKANYHAARHLVEACIRRLAACIGSSNLPAASRTAASEALASEINRTRAAAVSAPSDPSVWHVRRTVVDAAVDAAHAAREAEQAVGAQAAALIRDELVWVIEVIGRTPWLEVPWVHHRWLCAHVHAPRDGTHSTVDVDAALERLGGQITEVQSLAARRWARPRDCSPVL